MKPGSGGRWACLNPSGEEDLKCGVVTAASEEAAGVGSFQMALQREASVRFVPSTVCTAHVTLIAMESARRQTGLELGNPLVTT